MMPLPGGPSCRSVADCSGAGVCDVRSGQCQCAQGWGGADCSVLQVTQHVRPCGGGGLCEAGVSTWGGNAVQDDDGRWHLFSAIMSNNCTLGENEAE